MRVKPDRLLFKERPFYSFEFPIRSHENILLILSLDLLRPCGGGGGVSFLAGYAVFRQHV